MLLLEKEMSKVRTVKGKNEKVDVSQKVFYQKSAIIGLVVVVVLGVFLFAELKGVGKAWESATIEDPFYNAVATFTGEAEQGAVYYESIPKENKDKDEYGDTSSECKGKHDCDENCPYPNQQSATFCYSTSAEFCFAPSSVIRTSNQDSVCVDPSNYNTYKNKNEYTGLTDGTYNGYNWLNCKGDLKKTTALNGKFFCTDDKKFLPCVEDYDGVYKKDANNVVKFLCVASSKKWVTCDDKIGDQKLQLDNKFVCGADKVWSECKEANKGISGTKKYYCEKESDKWKWNECTENELSADGKQYCQQEGTPATWKWAGL